MDIKPEELRIGNYITDIWADQIDEKGNKKAYQVIKFTDKKAWYYKGNYSAEIKNIRPVKLTEEWLLKFGFKKSIYDGAFFIHLNNDHLFYIDIEKNIYGSIDNNEYKINLSYVHQLQNLYFDLTGKELTLKKDF
jgi:hypothetical protein